MTLKHDKLPSNFACFGFNFNLRPSTEDVGVLLTSFDELLTHGKAVRLSECATSPLTDKNPKVGPGAAQVDPWFDPGLTPLGFNA